MTPKHKRPAFKKKRLHRTIEPHPFHYLRQRSSFWIATLSILAFLVGNMVGQHGWYLFWKSVLGQQDDSLIVYTGTVAPVEYVPDYSRWLAYGGTSDDHTYRQVPLDILIKLPTYDQQSQMQTSDASTTASVYSVGHRGSYATGAENSGSHPGVDIRVPIGTPIVSIANGIVENVKWDAGGYGNVIVVRHPNVPDPANPKETTTLYSVYAHLSSALVTQGTIVQKGEKIALSGDTGFVSGPHLHFQIDRGEAPWHPYWPFTGREAQEAGLSLTEAIDQGLYSDRLETYTVNPMLFVQANLPPVVTTVSSAIQQSSVAAVQGVVQRERVSWTDRLQSKRNERIQLRLARGRTAVAVRAPVSQSPSAVAASSAPAALPPASTPVVSSTIVAERQVAEVLGTPQSVHSVEISHDGSYGGRGWEDVRVTLLDANGSVVANPSFIQDLAIKTAYGEADFRPSSLTALDFEQGRATVHMLPRGRRTVVIQVLPFGVLSQPMVYQQ